MVHTLCNRKSKSRPSSIDVLCRKAKSFASTSSEQDAQGEIRESAPGSLKSCDVVDLFVALRYEMALSKMQVASWIKLHLHDGVERVGATVI
jgi:hypothetical protein